MSKKAKFSIGDIVRVKNGSSPWRITKKSFGLYSQEFYYSGVYIKSNMERGNTAESKIHLYSQPKQCPACTNLSNEGVFFGDYCSPCHHEMENDMSTLYEVTLSETNTVYGHKLAVNSKNEWVMEPKGGGQVFTVDPAKVKEVLPYTVSIKFGHGIAVQDYDYISEPEEFSVGDYLVGPSVLSSDFAIAQVVGVDTKSKKATKTLSKFRKIA